MSLKGSLQYVPENISPNQDKGIYLVKAKDDVERLLYKYRKLNGGV